MGRLIFFGTANGIFQALRQRIKIPTNNDLKYCLLDFSKVSGIDSTGMFSFNRMIQWSQEHNITLVFSGVDQGIKDQFLQERTQAENLTMQFLPNLDRALEWCENEIISINLADLKLKKDIADQLKAISRMKASKNSSPTCNAANTALVNI